MNDTAPRWATRSEAAFYLRVDPKTIDRYAREGKLKRYYLAGGRKAVRYLVDDLDALVAPASDEDDLDEGNPPAA